MMRFKDDEPRTMLTLTCVFKYNYKKFGENFKNYRGNPRIFQNIMKVVTNIKINMRSSFINNQVLLKKKGRHEYPF